MTVFAVTLGLLAIFSIALVIVRWSDTRRESGVWRKLVATADDSVPAFEPSMVDVLPEPARRYFLFTIRLGTPLHTVSEIQMGGEMGLGDKENPNYQPMRGHQILAPPRGLVWKVTSGHGGMRLIGSDGFDGERSWTRFWLLNILPVVRVGGDGDHARSAFGRVVAEAVFWAPAALLPQNGTNWEAVDDNTARATVSLKGFTQTVDVSVAEDGQPVMVVIPRWSNANPEKTYQVQPFGGFLSEFREFDGFRIPTRVEGGNFIGTVDYFPFYKAEVESVRFGAGE